MKKHRHLFEKCPSSNFRSSISGLAGWISTLRSISMSNSLPEASLTLILSLMYITLLSESGIKSELFCAKGHCEFIGSTKANGSLAAIVAQW